MSADVASRQGEVVDLNRERVLRGLSQDPWVDVKTLARHLGFCDRTIRRWLSEDRYLIGGQRIPHRRVFGGPPRFQVAAVEAWLEGRR